MSVCLVKYSLVCVFLYIFLSSYLSEGCSLVPDDPNFTPLKKYVCLFFWLLAILNDVSFLCQSLVVRRPIRDSQDLCEQLASALMSCKTQPQGSPLFPLNCSSWFTSVFRSIWQKSFFSEKEMKDEHPGHLWKWCGHSARITTCRSNPIKPWKCPRILCEFDFCPAKYLLKALKRPFQFSYILPRWEAAVGYLHSRHLRGRTIEVV